MPSRTIILIPARLACNRLPNKPLEDLGGQPMVIRVWERAVASNLGKVVVACADQAIADVIKQIGGNYILTDPKHPSGSDRIAEAIKKIDPEGVFDRVINLQSDVPTIPSSYLIRVAAILDNSRVDIGSLVAPAKTSDIDNCPLGSWSWRRCPFFKTNFPFSQLIESFKVIRELSRAAAKATILNVDPGS